MVKFNDVERLSKTAVLNRYGWTQSSLKRFMQYHNHEVPNPRNAYAPIRLYDLDRIIEIEESAEWAEWIEEYREHCRISSRGGMAAAETQTNNESLKTLLEVD